MPLTEQTKREMLEGQQELRRKMNLPLLSPAEEQAWLMTFLDAEERMATLQHWIAIGKVSEVPVPARNPDRILPFGAMPRCGEQSKYVVKGETFIDDDPVLFPSPGFMARIILAAEFAPEDDATIVRKR